MNKAFRVFVPVLFSILAFGVFVPSAFASDTGANTGAKNPTVAAEVVSATGTGWDTPNNALIIGEIPKVLSADSTSALAASPATAHVSKYLKLIGFGFSIPTDATIVGIEVSVTRRGTGGSSGSADFIKDNSVILVGGSKNSEDKASPDSWLPSSTEFATKTYGGASDLWVITWTPAQINNSTFGLEISVQNTDTNSAHGAHIDGATIKVYYTVPAAKAIIVTAENFNTNKGADYYGPTVGYVLGGTDADQVASVSVALFDGSNNLLVTNTSKSAAKVNNSLQGPHYSSASIIIPGTYSTSSTWNFGDTSALSASVKPAKAIITVTDVNGFTYTAENSSFSEATATWENLFAKTTAKAEVATALGTYTETNYTAPNWTTLTGFKTAGDTNIDAATDLAGVSSAENTAISGMAGVVTDLADAKTVALTDLATAFGGYLSGSYESADWTTLTEFNSAGITAINGAVDLTTVASSKTTAINGMDVVVTIAETLTVAKTTALGNLATAFGGYDSNNYTTDNFATVTGFNNTGITDINATANLAGVTSAKNTATTGMAGVKTIAQTEAEALVAAKISAHNALTTTFGTYSEGNYTVANWTTLTGFKTNGDMAIDAATDSAGVILAQNTATDGMTAVVTDLLNAKATAYSALTTARALYTDGNYTVGNLATLNGFKSSGDTNINVATTLDDVTSAQGVATTGMAAVVTDLLNAKTTAHTALTTTLATYTQSNYTSPNWTTLTDFRTNGDTAIDDAITTDDVTTAQTNATAGMDGVTKLEVNQTKTETDSNGNGLATIDATTPEVVIASSTQPVIISVETPNATLDLTDLLKDGTGILPQMTITAGNASVEIPNGTTVTAPGWDGILSAPTAGTTSGTAPAGFSVGDTVIEMGSALQTLNFDQAVKITLTGVTGTVGYRPAGSTVWQTITTLCTSTDVSGILSGECSIPDGLGNTVIWTYHFTTFGGFNSIVYGCMDSIATNYNSSATSQTGVTCTYPTMNGSILSFSGRGGDTPNPLPGATAVTPATGHGQVLGAATYNFTRDLGIGFGGADVTALQQILIAAGILKIVAPTGNFGQLTKAAVQVFQKSHGVSQTGFVGPLTRGELNKGTVPTNFTTAQADAILSFLESFGVDASVVANMKASFGR